jgi:hypothetical protein
VDLASLLVAAEEAHEAGGGGHGGEEEGAVAGAWSLYPTIPVFAGILATTQKGPLP